MLRVEARLRNVDVERYRGKFASPKHARRTLTQSCAVYLPGAEHPVAVYGSSCRAAAARGGGAARRQSPAPPGTDGMMSLDRTMATRRSWRCAATGRAAWRIASRPTRRAHAVIIVSTLVEQWYSRLHAELYDKHAQTVAQVLPEWRLGGGGGVFTSGIINRNNQLPYHFDKGNFADCWSNMLVFKNACAGGDLVCPELDLCFKVRDHSLLMFDGQSIMHGVYADPLTRRDGYRYSVFLQPAADVALRPARRQCAPARAPPRERERRPHPDGDRMTAPVYVPRRQADAPLARCITARRPASAAGRAARPAAVPRRERVQVRIVSRRTGAAWRTRGRRRPPIARPLRSTGTGCWTTTIVGAPRAPTRSCTATCRSRGRVDAAGLRDACDPELRSAVVALGDHQYAWNARARRIGWEATATAPC
jgi:hypothetical protein